ncbi:hypothetical protein B0H17DRAFT_1194147 [Mycena rosella]|uniref:Uncharacterized protein n=1 Tax=Mycena rosella TaxID=1033263 RepID=A0AAD7GRG8_MYCRO|nr:hypothetical protein B0H17DRAFT_1194147 [Mycena rosella]
MTPYIFYNINQDYLSLEDIEAAVSLVAERCTQKGKGREEPPAKAQTHQEGPSAFLSPIAQEMEEGEVNQVMPLADPPLGGFFDPTAVCSDLHLNADTECAIAENVLANREAPDFYPVQIEHAKANSLGLDPSPTMQGASTSRLPDESPGTTTQCPDSPSDISLSPPKETLACRPHTFLLVLSTARLGRFRVPS